MLVCGCVNPPPVSDPTYGGIFFTSKDDLPAKAAALGGTPLRVEHGGPRSDVGQVLSAWTARDGSMFALAEIDTATPAGAAAAAGVRAQRLQGLSLGYTSQMTRAADDPAAPLRVGEKRIRELSICAEGAHTRCRIVRAEPR